MNQLSPELTTNYFSQFLIQSFWDQPISMLKTEQEFYQLFESSILPPSLSMESLMGRVSGNLKNHLKNCLCNLPEAKSEKGEWLCGKIRIFYPDNIETPCLLPADPWTYADISFNQKYLLARNRVVLWAKLVSLLDQHPFEKEFKNTTDFTEAAEKLPNWYEFNKKALQEIKKLDLSDCGLTAVPEEIHFLTNLSHLNLKNNQLNTYPKPLANLHRIQQIDLAGNPLSSKTEILETKDSSQKDLVKKLANISDLPSEICSLIYRPGNLDESELKLCEKFLKARSKLILWEKFSKSLGLPFSKYESVSAMITHAQSFEKWCKNHKTELQQIQGLSFYNCLLYELPAEIGFLTNLKELILSKNELTTLPRAIQKLKNLQALTLESNQFSSLPNAISKLPNLERLFISKNHIKQLPTSKEILENHPELQWIQATGNPLTDEALKTLQKLQSKRKSLLCDLNVIPERAKLKYTKY